MTICKFFIQGSCRFGNKCWYEHPTGANGGPQRQLNFSNFGESSGGQGGGGAFQSNARQGNQQQQQQGNKYKWTAQQVGGAPPAFGGNQPGSPQQGQLMSPQEIISGLSREITTWESSKMWLLSCVSFQKSGPSIPGMTDMSPEELRFEAYETQKNENFQDYIVKVQQMHNDYSAKRQELKAPSNQLRDKLIEFIETSRKQQAITSGTSSSRFSAPPAGGSAFGATSAVGQGGAGFGGETSKVFGGASTNLFGKSEPAAANPFAAAGQQTNAFAGSSTGSAFGFPPSQAPAPGANVFGNSGAAAGAGNPFGGQMGTPAAGVFGNATTQGFGAQPVAQVPGASAFGTQSAVPAPQASAFGGGGGSVFGSPAMAAGSAPATGLFGKPAAPGSGFGQQSVFGSGMGAPAEQGSLFGPGPAGASVFGQSQPAASEVTATMYTPMESLTPAELEQYQAQKFILGKIPTRPPPRELCF